MAIRSDTPGPRRGNKSREAATSSGLENSPYSALIAPTPTASPTPLYTAREVKVQRETKPALATTLDWMFSFLSQPHPDLGRTGAVCPYVPHALKINTIWLTEVEDPHITRAQIEELIACFHQVFLGLEPREGLGIINKALLIVFPHITPEQAPELIDKVQQALKPVYTRSGLMLGEFHRDNRSPGLRNPHFFPLRSPYPMLVIRHMVDSDLPFLMRDEDSPDVRIGFLRSYLLTLARSLTNQKLMAAVEALIAAELERYRKEITQGIEQT